MSDLSDEDLEVDGLHHIKHDVAVLESGSTLGTVRLCEDEADFAAWDRFLFDYPGAHYFQTYGWLKSYEAMGLTAGILIYEEGKKIIGGLGFVYLKIPFSPLRIYIVPHGPIPANPETPSWKPLMDRLDTICRSNNAIYAQIYPHEPSDCSHCISPLEGIGFVTPALFTAHQFSTEPVTVDLRQKTENDVLQSVRERTRTYIRRAINSRLQLRTEMDESTFDLIYSLFEQHGEGRGFRPRPKSSLRIAWEWFSKRGGAAFVQAWHGNTLVGANFVIFTGRTAYYIHGAVHRGFAEQRPAEFLHWHTIRKALELKLENYDLVNWGPPGVAQFKRGFRPRHHYWQAPRSKIYRPTLARVFGVADRFLRPALRGLARHWAGRVK